MKKKIYYLILVSFFALFTLTSCQDDTEEVNAPDEQETLLPNSELANLMLRTSANDGSLDNLLDNANCLSINLPVTIVANGITITINTLEDLDLIEAIFEEFENDEDILEFLFPITIVLNDYTEINISSVEELEAFIDECDDEIDTDIECIDFQYPISFSLYDSNFQITETVEIENDETLYQFLEDLNNSDDGVVLASLNFPVTLVYANGETIVVNNHNELEEAINAAEEDCENEDDDCNAEDVEMYLQECHWRIAAYNEDDVFQNLYLFFNENEDLQILNGSTTQYIEGNWDLSISNDGHVEIVITELNGFQEDLGGSWIVVECDDDRFELVREFEGTVTTMVIEQECENELECSAQEIGMYLQECLWYAGTNLYNNVISDTFQFSEDGLVLITNPQSNEVLTGTWNIELTDAGIFIVLDLPLPYDLISLEWKVTDCDDDRIEMINEDNYLVFERDCNTSEYDCEDLQANVGDECESNGLVGYINEDCECVVENENPFECFIEGDELEACSDSNDGFATFDLTLAFAECTQPPAIVLSYFETIVDADANVNAIANPEAYTNITNPQTIYVRVEVENNFEVFEITLYAENCNSNDCSEENIDANLIECQWNVVNYNGSDDLSIYNFDFEENSGIVVIYNDNVTIDAFWSTSQTNDGVIIEFSNVAGANIQAITGIWLVVECTDGRLELVRENDFMVLERSCD